MGEIRQIYPDDHINWLPDGTKLWRYVPLQTLFFYLSGNIFIPSIEKLKAVDPFEGEFHFDTAWFKTEMEKHYGDQNESVLNWIQKYRFSWKECVDFRAKVGGKQNYSAVIFRGLLTII